MSRQLIVAVALALAGAACASRQNGDRTAQGQPDSVFIAAFNDNFYDARVHAVYTGGQRRSLGTIAGNGGHARVALAWEPRPLVFLVSFVIDGRAYVSYPVEVIRGQAIEVRVPPNINESGFFRRVSRN